MNIVHSDTHSFHHSETHSLSPSLCSAFQSNFHSWHRGSAYLPISVSVPEWVICKAMFTSTLRRFTQEWACQVFELSVRSAHKLAEWEEIAILSQFTKPTELLCWGGENMLLWPSMNDWMFYENMLKICFVCRKCFSMLFVLSGDITSVKNFKFLQILD